MTFTPPTEDSVPRTNAPNSPEWRQNPLGNRLMRYFTQPQRGRNIYIVDGVATEDYPSATYNADGTVDQSAVERITRVFYGGHIGEDVTAEEQTILEAAGYSVS